MKQLLHNPWTLFGAYYIIANIIGGMPAPKPTSSTGYVWAYNSLSLIAANAGKVLSQVRSGASPLAVAENTQAMAAGVSSSVTSKTVATSNDPYSDLRR